MKTMDVPESVALKERFDRLTASWKAECAVMSSTRDIAMNGAYQQIIGMGPAVLPLLLEEMRNRPHHWAWALRAITGEDPVPIENRGKIMLMAEDWVRWGKQHGYIQ